MHSERAMTRASVRICIEAIKKKWWFVLLLGVLFFFIANYYGWRSYDSGYQIAVTFTPARLEGESIVEVGTRAKAFAAIVKDEQLSGAVSSAVSFPMSEKDYDEALSVSHGDNNVDITVTLRWQDKAQLAELTEVFQTYLSYIVHSRLNLGSVAWLDSYEEAAPLSSSSQYVTAAVYGMAGGILGLLAGCFFVAAAAVCLEQVFDLSIIRYRRAPRFVGMIPRKDHGEFRASCDILARMLLAQQADRPIHTVAWVTVGRRWRDDTAAMVAQSLKELGCETVVSPMAKEMQEKPLAREEGGLVPQEEEAAGHPLQIVLFPDILKHRGLWYLLTKADLVVLDFRYGNCTAQTIQYVEEQCPKGTDLIYVWTKVSGSALKRPTVPMEEM